MLSVIEHLEDFESVLKEIRRVLKPGGICIITTDIGKKDVTHVNVHKRSFWIKVFQSHNFQPINGEAASYFTKKLCGLYSKANPDSKIAKFLLKLGKIGEYIRKRLIYLNLKIRYSIYAYQFILRNVK